MPVSALIGQNPPGQFAIGDPGTINPPPAGGGGGSIPPFNPLVYSPGICQPVVSPIDDGANPVSNVADIAWQTDQTISAFKAFQWNIPQTGVTVQGALAWNAYLRVETVIPFIAFGLARPVVMPIDQYGGISADFNETPPNIEITNKVPGSAWSVDFRTDNTQASSWKVMKTNSAFRRALWNIRVPVTAYQRSLFNTLFRVYKPGTSVEELTFGVVQQTVHPIDYGLANPSPTSSWNLNERLQLKERSTWMMRIAEVIREPIAFNTNGILVSTSYAMSWMTMAKVSPVARSTWNLFYRVPTARRASSWMLRFAVSPQESIHWRLFNKVTQTGATTWNLIRRPAAKVVSEWMLLTREHSTAGQPEEVSTWNVYDAVVRRTWNLLPVSPGSISTSVVHPIDVRTPNFQPFNYYGGICNPVVMPIDYDNWPGYGWYGFAGIQWRVPIYHLTGGSAPQGQILWNVYRPVKDTPKIAWNLVGRTGKQVLSLYNVLNHVAAQAIIEWIVGKPLAGQIFQTSIDRTDFTY